MNGYGEFYWSDGKKYAGYYVNDKKEGFGIYYWTNPAKAYIGFWKDGKQEGVGKYISQNKVKYGHWVQGERTKWYKSEEDALSELLGKQRGYVNLFKYTLKEISQFLNS